MSTTISTIASGTAAEIASVTSTIDFDLDGRHAGDLRVKCSDNTAPRWVSTRFIGRINAAETSNSTPKEPSTKK